MRYSLKALLESPLHEEELPSVEVYFDMDGVLADFDKAVNQAPGIAAAKKRLDQHLAKKPEMADLHQDELKKLLRGQQEDPYMKRLKKLFNSWRGQTYAAASKEGHFANLEPMPGAIEMVKKVTELIGKKPHILTAPMASAKNCEEEKNYWVDKHLKGMYDQFICTQQKEAYAEDEYTILIDDRPKYVNAFKAAGGKAILHTDPADTIQQLEEHLESLRSLDEISAISGGGGGLQPSGQVSGTGGTPLGKDMSDEHERMWSGDEPINKNKKPVSEETLGRKGKVRYYQMGGSLPKKFYNVTQSGKGTKDPGVPPFKKGKDSSKQLEKDRKKKKRWYQKEISDSKEMVTEIAALFTAAVTGYNVEPDRWESGDSPRVSKVNQQKNEEYIKKLDVTPARNDRDMAVHVDWMDPQYKRQLSIIMDPENTLPWAEPVYREPEGEHRLSELGYSKVADRDDALIDDVYLYPYDPNWRRSEDIVQQSIRHWMDTHSPPRVFPDADADMFVSIQEEPVMFHRYKLGQVFKEEQEQSYYHGTSVELEVGDLVEPPTRTGRMAEKGRKKNLDKVFVTTSPKYAKIYAGRAKQSLGGQPYVYEVEPLEPPEALQTKPGSEVMTTTKARVIRKVH